MSKMTKSNSFAKTVSPILANIYLFKANNRNTRKRWDISIFNNKDNKTPKRC